MNCMSFPHSFVISYKEPLRPHKLESNFFLSLKTRLASEPSASRRKIQRKLCTKKPNKMYSFSYSIGLIYTKVTMQGLATLPSLLNHRYSIQPELNLLRV